MNLRNASSPPGAARLAPALLLAAALTAGAASPAAAELQVRVSRSVVPALESVGISVTDPRGGLDADPGPLQVTMADGRDRRQTVWLSRAERPGEWRGRFTPLTSGRYTGTAVLRRGPERDIGLVPLLRVGTPTGRGFVRLNPGSTRALRYSNGGTLFPIGVRLRPDSLSPGTNWKEEFARLRAHDVNFLELPVPWPGELPEAEQEQALRLVDAALLEAEQVGRLGIQLRLSPPVPMLADGIPEYEAQLRQWALRWAYSPAVAVWYVAGATDAVSPDTRARFVRAIRAADPYQHLVAVPRTAGDESAAADLVVAPWDWQRPAHRFAILETPDAFIGAQPLPGESSWQMLVVGGIGLPLWPYRPGAPEAAAILQRVRRLAQVAGTIPYSQAAAPVTGLLPVDAPGSFCRYGPVWVGWLAPDGVRSLDVRPLARGRYQVRFWDPGGDAHVSDTVIWSDGSGSKVQLPSALRAVYVHVQPAPASAGARSTAVKRTATRKPTASKTAAKKKSASASSRKPSRAAKSSARPATKKSSTRARTASSRSTRKPASSSASARRKKAPTANKTKKPARRSTATPSRPSSSKTRRTSTRKRSR